MNKIKTYAIPDGVQKNDKYTVKVRPVGEVDWTEIECYNVKVDMHEPSDASVVYFDFDGEVEIDISLNISAIYKAVVRPLSRRITAEIDENCKAFREPKHIRFKLDRPEKLSIEINGDRFHNLHLFAEKIEEYSYDEDNAIIMGQSFGDIKDMPKGRTLVFEAGIHYIGEIVCKIPSDTNVLIKGGAVVVGAFVCENAENIKIYGRGVIYQGNLEWYTSVNGIRISHCKNIEIEGITFINPPHYTISIGGSDNVSIKNAKTFSCGKWTDGFDMMSSRDVTVDNCFLRTSDDCIAIYGRRWKYNGDTRNVLVKDTVLWADVAHPTNIGTHGDYENEGNIIENITFKNIDILEHHEYQSGYLGCLSINVGDKNLARNILYEDIRIEYFEHGKIFDFQVKFNPDYNPAPGRGIENVTLNNVSYNGHGAETSVIKGYDETRCVKNVSINNLAINGKPILSAEDGDIEIGEFAENVRFA